MQPITVNELLCAYDLLSRIENPSERVKNVLEIVLNGICLHYEGMTTSDKLKEMMQKIGI
jgi:hypothetical protein